MVVPTLDGFYEGFQHEGADGLMAGDTFLEIDGYRIHQRSDVDTAIQRGAADGEFDILVRRNGEKVLISDLKMRPDVEVDGRMLYGLRFATAEITLPLRMQTAFWESVNLAARDLGFTARSGHRRSGDGSAFRSHRHDRRDGADRADQPALVLVSGGIHFD